MFSLTASAPFPVVTPDMQTAADLPGIVDGLQRFFGVPFHPPVRWAVRNVRAKTVLLVFLDASGVAIDPVFAHPRVPADVRSAAVFLGMLMLRARDAQKQHPKNVLAHDELVEWIDTNLRLHSGAEFLMTFLARFQTWAASIIKA